MYSLIIKQFIRSRSVITTLALILIMGFVSILIGRQFLAKEERNIAEVTRQQQEHIERNVQYHENDMGLLLYYVRFAFINKPDKLSALSIGQRDINSSLQSVTIRTLEAQKYDTDLSNPANLLSGNLDLGFVLIYLFPLVIVAFTFNVLSEEDESGTWRIVAVQSRSMLGFLLQKISTRALVVYGVLLGLMLCAVLTLSLSINKSLLAFVILSMLYLAFWFSLSLLVISFQRSSSFNALVLLSIWVVLAILVPATVNSYVANRYPVPESLSTLIRQRDGYHQKWDEPRDSTIAKFKKHYPQFSHYHHPEGADFSWLWYYTMQQMGDDESRNESSAMREKIMQREMLSRKLAMVIPTMHTQLLFNDIAGTSLGNHLDFLDQTTAFHEKIRLHFYPKIFENASAKNENWNSFQPEYAVQHNTVSWTNLMMPMFLLIGLLTAFALLRFRTRMQF